MLKLCFPEAGGLRGPCSAPPAGKSTAVLCPASCKAAPGPPVVAAQRTLGRRGRVRRVAGARTSSSGRGRERHSAPRATSYSLSGSCGSVQGAVRIDQQEVGHREPLRPDGLTVRGSRARVAQAPAARSRPPLGHTRQPRRSRVAAAASASARRRPGRVRRRLSREATTRGSFGQRCVPDRVAAGREFTVER